MSVIGLRIKVNVVVPDDSQLLLAFTKALFGCCRMANKKKLIRELLKDMILCSKTPLKWTFCKVDIIQNPITEFQCLIFIFLQEIF